MTRTDGQGRPYVTVPALAGAAEYGPLLRAVGAAGWVGGAGTPVTERALAPGDAVLVTDVAGSRSVFVVLARLE